MSCTGLSLTWFPEMHSNVHATESSSSAADLPGGIETRLRSKKGPRVTSSEPPVTPKQAERSGGKPKTAKRGATDADVAGTAAGGKARSRTAKEGADKEKRLNSYMLFVQQASPRLAKSVGRLPVRLHSFSFVTSFRQMTAMLY